MLRPERVELAVAALRPGPIPSLAIERRQVQMDDRQAWPNAARGLRRRSMLRPERAELLADALRAVERPSCARAASACLPWSEAFAGGRGAVKWRWTTVRRTRTSPEAFAGARCCGPSAPSWRSVRSWREGAVHRQARARRPFWCASSEVVEIAIESRRA
jgi:hypothetical protein